MKKKKKTITSTNISIILSSISIVTSLLLIFVYNKVAIGVCFIVGGFSVLSENIEKKKNENKEK